MTPYELSLLVLITGTGAVGGLVPFSPLDPLLVGLAAIGSPATLVIGVLLATASQMCTKALLFAGCSKAERLLPPGKRARVDRITRLLRGRVHLQIATVFVSAVFGLPPLYLVTVVCGALQLRLRSFVLVAGIGRALRFAALVFIPYLLGAGSLRAQSARPAVVEVGAGEETWVLLSGLVGGTTGFQQLAQRLGQAGHRVIVIDPYALSLDSADVSFAALARRVSAVLAARDVRAARFAGHAHGAGVMLRLAAAFPSRALELYFLDVGALEVNRSKVFSESLRLVPLIMRVPGGRGFVRGRFVAGLEDNSGSAQWLTVQREAAYADPILDNIDRVIALAARLNEAREPEPLATVVARVRAPVTVILGTAPHASGPEAMEIAALGGGVRIERLAGIGHFVHEEAPDAVARVLLARPTRLASRGAAQ